MTPFVRWRDTHPAGFIINHDREPKSSYLRLHPAMRSTLLVCSPHGVITGRRPTQRRAAPGYITIVAAIVLLGGVQLLCIGVIGEYVGRIFLETKHRPHYLVAETGDCDPRPPIISSSANTGSGSIKSTSAGIRSRRSPGSPEDG
jgi:hypothetical protein